MTTIDILNILGEELPIEKFRFVKFSQWKLIQEYLPVTETNIKLITESSVLSDNNGLPFWDAALLVSSNSKEWNRDLISFANHHNPIKDDFWIDANRVASLNEGDNENIGINSLVESENGIFSHIPMLDFHLSISENGKDLVKNVINQIGFTSGYIINSGKSYHFIGDVLITETQLIDFLSKSILFGPITDTRWIAHQLLERSCTLRIGKKNGILPFVISKL